MNETTTQISQAVSTKGRTRATPASSELRSQVKRGTRAGDSGLIQPHVGQRRASRKRVWRQRRRAPISAPMFGAKSQNRIPGGAIPFAEASRRVSRDNFSETVIHVVEQVGPA